MATKKAGGSSKNGRDSAGRRLGPKVGDGEKVFPGNILMRQRGSKFYPGKNVIMGKDFTLHSLIVGAVSFDKRSNRTYIHVV